ncbi:MAG TPA: acyl-CoA reductase [Chitinophagaceae bacterium]|jgi:hypothetical protein
MDLQQRINVLVRLGEYLQSDNKIFESVKYKAQSENPWFTHEFINKAIANITQNFLQRGELETWRSNYTINKDAPVSKTVGIVMAGNIPLVGFHDMLCVFVSGHKAVIKLSSKDEVLIKHTVQKMCEWESSVQHYISFADSLKGCDAYLATGSNNSGRYFEYYFGKYPSIIRLNRTSVAVLDGTETKAELDLLADDIQSYFGLGCRSITKLYVPGNYNFIPLLDALKKYDYLMDFHKYKHNYDYQLALLIMNNRYYMNNGSVLITENESVFSPVSQINYEFYHDKNVVITALKKNNNIQCMIGHNLVNFGVAQSPKLNDYADGVDTMTFLTKL